jgi:hypothetical protein
VSIFQTNFANPFVKQHLGRCYYQPTPLLASTEHRYIRIIDNRLLKFCCVPATSATSSKAFSAFFAAAINGANEANKADVCGIEVMLVK